MNINLKRHNLLGILFKPRSEWEINKAENIAIGVPFDKICNELNCQKDELPLITSELFSSDEIGPQNTHGIVGLCAKPKGLTAYSNKKYKRLNNARIKNNLKDFVQIIIPVFALVVAILTLSIKIENLNTKTAKEIKTIELRQKHLQDQIDILNNQKESWQKDSLR